MIGRHDITARLTTPQRLAVCHINGPLLVLAGPGSGKTRVITHRIAYMIDCGIRPYNILAITFTNKAAEEMRNRLIALGIPRGCTICTFHSLGARLLREFAEQAALSPNFTIYDEPDQLAVMKEALKVAELDSQNYPPAWMLGRIGQYKNDLITTQQLESESADFTTKITARAYRAYEKQLRENQALDFDDLLMRTALLLRDRPQLRDMLNDRYKYVLVDEYQDTNHCQYQIARGLSLNHKNLCVTGDPDQSIYGWRGADIGNILAFESDFPDAMVVRLEESFRSTPQILSVANELICVNQQRKHKDLFTSKPSGPVPEFQEYYDEHEEADGIVRQIKKLHQGGLAYKDVAIFYRVNSMSRVLETALRSSAVAYRIVRGVEFYKRKEIKDMLAYLKFLANPSDQVSLKRIINQPTRGIGQVTVNRLFNHSQKTGDTILELLAEPGRVDQLGQGPCVKLKNFYKLIAGLQEALVGPVYNLASDVYEKSGLERLFSEQGTTEQAENIQELIHSAAQYDTETDRPSLVDYLQQIALVSDTDTYDSQSGAVSLMTLHAAKGLEFPAVFIAGVEEGLIPHINSSDSETGIEEERRLLFVGITRAKEKLSMSYALTRTVHGAPTGRVRSSFVRSLASLRFNESENDFTCNGKFPVEADSPDQESSSDYGQINRFSLGQMVRHPKMGLGRIYEIMPSRNNSRVVVQFTNGSRKTLVLQYAKLEVLDFDD